MPIRTMLWVAGLAAALALLAGAGSASALRSLRREGTEATVSGRLTLSTEIVEVICEVTFDGRTSTTIPKTAGTSFGRLTRITTAGCRSSTGTFRRITFLGLENERLWGLTYQSFTGTLPTPTGYRFRLEGVQALVEVTVILTVGCLYEGRVEGLAPVEARGAIERIKTREEAPETIEVSLLRTLTGTCPSRARVKASLTPGATVRVVLL